MRHFLLEILALNQCKCLSLVALSSPSLFADLKRSIRAREDQSDLGILCFHLEVAPIWAADLDIESILETKRIQKRIRAPQFPRSIFAF